MLEAPLRAAYFHSALLRRRMTLPGFSRWSDVTYLSNIAQERLTAASSGYLFGFRALSPVTAASSALVMGGAMEAFQHQFLIRGIQRRLELRSTLR
jgi:hypothetical protein